MGDLHLSFSNNKPMDIFGRRWKNHVAKIEKNWKKKITSKDTIVLTGDHSWGRNLDEAQEDLNFIIFLHYPPTTIGEQDSPFTKIALEYNVSKVIYSHCHGEERFDDSFKGYVDGLEYKLVSGDYLNFKPELILP